MSKEARKTVKGFCLGCQSALDPQNREPKELVEIKVGDYTTLRCWDCILKGYTEFYTSQVSIYAKIVEDAIGDANDGATEDVGAAVHRAVSRILSEHGIIDEVS